MKTSIRLMAVLMLIVLTGPTVPGQTPGTRPVMREKLVHSQRLLEAILASNLALLETESEALVRITRLPAWSALRGPEYVRQSEAFLETLGELRSAARERDLDTAAKRYAELTMTCYACHRYMKDQRLAR